MFVLVNNLSIFPGRKFKSKLKDSCEELLQYTSQSNELLVAAQQME
jgi:hypothetical protein